MSQNKSQLSFTFDCEIDGKNLKNVENGKCFKSKTFNMSAAFKGIQYYFSMYPNGKEEDQKGSMWISFNVGMRHKKDIQVKLNFSTINGQEVSETFVYNGSGSQGFKYAEHLEMVYEKNQQADDFVFQCNVIVTLLKTGEAVIKSVPSLLGQSLFNDEGKDLKMIVGDQEIMVHKCVLSSFSPIFKAMLKTSENELQAIIEIPDFHYAIIKSAIDYCYGVKFVNDESVDRLLLLLKFASKYAITYLKTEVEYSIMSKVCRSNICKVSNCAIENNAELLQKLCHDQLKSFTIDKKVIPDLDTLDAQFLKEVLNHVGISSGRCIMKNNSQIDENLNSTDRFELYAILFLFCAVFFIFWWIMKTEHELEMKRLGDDL